MQHLHLVGFTAELDGLIFSTRRGSKSGGYVVSLDDRLLDSIREAVRLQTGAELDLEPEEGAAASVAIAAVPELRRLGRVHSALSPKDIQARLRAGRSVAEVADEAEVDESWILRFASPVLAEQSRIVERALRLPCRANRKGESAEPLEVSVTENLVERGTLLTPDEISSAWSAYHVRDSAWVVRFRYVSRRRQQVAQWAFDLADSTLVPINRLATELGYVEPGRRKRRVLPDVVDDRRQPGSDDATATVASTAARPAAKRRAAGRKGGGATSKTRRAATATAGRRPAKRTVAARAGTGTTKRAAGSASTRAATGAGKRTATRAATKATTAVKATRTAKATTATKAVRATKATKAVKSTKATRATKATKAVKATKPTGATKATRATKAPNAVKVTRSTKAAPAKRTATKAAPAKRTATKAAKAPAVRRGAAGRAPARKAAARVAAPAKATAPARTSVAKAPARPAKRAAVTRTPEAAAGTRVPDMHPVPNGGLPNGEVPETVGPDRGDHVAATSGPTAAASVPPAPVPESAAPVEPPTLPDEQIGGPVATPFSGADGAVRARRAAVADIGAPAVAAARARPRPLVAVRATQPPVPLAERVVRIPSSETPGSDGNRESTGSVVIQAVPAGEGLTPPTLEP